MLEEFEVVPEAAPAAIPPDNTRVDLFVLNVLREELENKNIGFVEFRKYLIEELVSELDTTVDEMEKRIFYNIGLGFIEIEKSFESIEKVKARLAQERIENSDIIKMMESGEVIDQDAYFRQFVDIKITSLGLNRIIELEALIKENASFSKKFSKLKKFFEALLEIKKIVSIVLAIILILAVWIFDANIGKLLKQIPLLNSVVDTDLLGRFVPIDENDDFYKVLKENVSDANLVAKPASGVTVQMKKVSNSERIFKLSTARGGVLYYRIKKSNDAYIIEKGPNETSYKKTMTLPLSTQNNLTDLKSSVVNAASKNTIHVESVRPEGVRSININMSDSRE